MCRLPVINLDLCSRAVKIAAGESSGGYMKILYAVACIVALSAGAYADDLPAVPAAFNALYKCLQTQTAELDDHSSDARTIADAALFSCRKQYEAYVRLFADPTSLQSIMSDFNKREGLDKAALVVVLKARRAAINAVKKSPRK